MKRQMIKQSNFLLMTKDEFRPWLVEQVITRLIKGFQVHHTAFPNYITRKIVDGVGVQDKFKCLEGMRNYHLSEGWAATGQNITIFEDGMIAISLDRPLNRIPAGIKGANNGYICIENIGYFDKGNDQMQLTQRDSILHVYACLCEKFKLPVNTDTIVYHAWFTNKGERLNDYIPSRSSKTCPGTYWWNDGNTVSSAKKNFLPQIQNELNKLNNNAIPINTNKDDQPMTAEETKAFETLKKTVEQQTSQIENLNNSKNSLKETNLAQDTYLKKLEDRLSAIENKEHMQVPDWAKDAVDTAIGSGLIKEPDNASYDFYRLLTVLHRKGII